MSQLGELEGSLEASLRWMLRDDVDITGVICETFSVAAPDPLLPIPTQDKDSKNPLDQNCDKSTPGVQVDAESKESSDAKKERVVALCNGGGI